MADDPLDVLFAVASALDGLEIPHMVVGSLASSMYGYPRIGAEADLLVSIKPKQATGLFEALRGEFYIDEQTITRAAAARQHFSIIHAGSTFRVDFFTAAPEGFDKEQMERRQRQVVKDNPVYVATPEDTILAKLVWYRKGNEISDQQWRDILGVIRVQGDKLDLEYLRRWAEELGVADLLTRAMQ